MGALDDLLSSTEKKSASALDMLAEQAPQEKPFGLMDTWPVRLAKGAYHAVEDAATLPGDVYSGKQKLDDLSLTGRALNFAILGSPAAGAGTKIPVAPGGIKAPTEDALFAAGGKGYDFARGSKVALRGEMMSPWSRMIQSKLNRKGFFDTNNNAPTTFAVLRQLESGSKDNFITAGDYINLRQALQKQAQSGGQESGAATYALKQLDELFDKAPQAAFVAGTPAEISGVRAAIKDARENFAAGFRSREVTGREHAADLRSAAANSGKNYDNSLRQRLAGIPLSKKASSGYTDEEIAAIEGVVEGSVGRNFTRDLSNKMGGGGGLAASVYAIPGIMTSLATGHPATAALGLGIPAAGAALKGAENLLTKRDVRRLDNMIRSRSAAGRQIEQAASAKPKQPALPASSQAAYRLFMDYLAQNPNES
jgi:hypothetical protein